MYDVLIRQMREEVTTLGAKELRTPEEVDETIPNAKGTMLVFVNSVCGCAAGMARPGLARAMSHRLLPDRIVTVFVGQDVEATARARQYFSDQPPSSPSFALMRDGKLVAMIHRFQIEDRTADEVAQELKNIFEEHCNPVHT